MNNDIRVLIFILLVSFSGLSPAFAQQSNKGWFHIPGFTAEIPITLTNERTFWGVMGAATLSYALAEFVFKENETLNFYQLRTGMANEHNWGLKNVWHQSFGLEKRVAPWFAFAAELNLQEWNDNSPELAPEKRFGIGVGIMTYYRWYLLGRKKVSPFLEYGTGLFQGFEKFPHNGTRFTFNHATRLGVELTFKNNDRFRLGYGQLHQSNNGLERANPGFDANGFSVSYSWFWTSSKW